VAAIQIREESAPILVVKLKGVAGHLEYGAYLDAMAGVLDAKRPYAFVIDATLAGPAPEWQRRMMADFIRENRPAIQRYVVGYAFVSASPVFRFELSSIFVAQPLPVPYTVKSDLREGFAWIEVQLEKAGLARSLSTRYRATAV
jgi:hypothetical protein